MSRIANPLSKKTIKTRAKVFNVCFILACIFAAMVAFKGSYKGYDEYREERYQYYTFVYQNNTLQEIRVKPNVFNVLCDEYNTTEHNCTLKNKRSMREFKELVNR
jgi:hypothetical protein